MNNLEDPMKMNVGHFKRLKRHHHALENGPCQGYRDEINQDSKTLQVHESLKVVIVGGGGEGEEELEIHHQLSK